MTLDFSGLSTQELAAYFGEGDLNHKAGYTNYELQFKYQDGHHFKDRLTSLLTPIENIESVNVLELGGARGHRLSEGGPSQGLGKRSCEGPKRKSQGPQPHHPRRTLLLLLEVDQG